MTKDEALRLLRGGPKGIQEWNRVREWEGKYKDIPSLAGAALSGLELSLAVLGHIDLSGANLSKSNMRSVHLRGANLSGADLRNAFLDDADLSRADFNGTKLHGAKFGGTIIACDLSQALGLNETHHMRPSYVDVNSSILCFKNELPEKFLHGCGLRDEEIAYFRSRVGQPIRFYSCFISYSTADEDFATRLENDFQAAGIRCWKWNHDARTGENLWSEIDRAICLHDKVVLIASESSLKSPEVIREIERAIVQEDERLRMKHAGEFEGNPNVLFPVRVDNYIFKGWKHERKVDVTKKVIADACGWDSDPKVYKEVLARLIRDLKPEPAP